MSADPPERHFEWPPDPRKELLLWLPRMPEEAVEALRARVQSYFRGEESRVRTRGDGSLAVSDARRTALVRRQREGRGGTIITVGLRRRRWLLSRPSFDSIRYPFVTTLGTIFVLWLGLGREHIVPWGVYQGCVWLLGGMSAVLWSMWGIEFLREARQRALAPGDGCLDPLASALHELGARAIPASDSPFRR